MRARMHASVVAVALAGLASACSKDGGTAADPNVASVAVAGAPVAAIPAGTSVQLSATAHNAKGTVLTGHATTWRSSNWLIARVDTSGLVSAIDSGTATITATIETRVGSASIQVSPPPVSSVRVSPASAKLYVNRTTAFTVELRNARGRVVTGHAVSWRSLDETKATVDQAGVVTAHAEGTVTITASSDGVSGSAVVGVIPAANVDWSAAADWPTFQGNAGHNGFVAVTIDPLAFNERWVIDIGAGGLNPVAAADGKLFVTTGYGFVTVLDANTGARKWTYALGGGTNPPAYGNGTLFVATTFTGSGTAFLWGFDPNTGVIRFRSPYPTQWQQYYAPVVVGQTVIFAGGEYGGMEAMSAANGALQWSAGLDQNDQFTPAVRDGVAYAHTGVWSPRLSAIDVGSGAVVYEVPDPNWTINGWTTSLNAAPALGTHDDLFSTQGGRLVCFDLANRRIKWERRDAFTGTAAIAGDVLYVIDGDHVSANQASDGAPLWSWTPPGGPPSGTLLVTNNVLFASTATTTYAIDLQAHATLWTYPAGGALALTREGTLLIAQGNGRLAAIDLR